MRRPIFCLFIFFFITFSSFAQTAVYLPLDNSSMRFTERILPADSLREHSSIRPFLTSESVEQAQDSFRRELQLKDIPHHGSKGRFIIYMTPQAEYGTERSTTTDSRFYGETFLHSRFTHGRKLAAAMTLGSGIAEPKTYTGVLTDSTHFMSGLGQSYRANNSFSYQYYSGSVSYSPSRIFNFRAGRDKHFWGDGYRSLFLSDNASPFPFLQLSATAWRFKYVSLFAMLSDRTSGPLHSSSKSKYGTFHYLSWNVSRRVNFSLFESIIWQGTHPDRYRSFDVNYLNPVIFFRPVEYSLGSSDNSFLGGGFRIRLGEQYKTHLYGQAILDEFLLKEVMAFFKKLGHLNDPTYPYGWWGNKQGVQLGIRAMDMFTLKNLDQRLEFNAVRPYTYSHGSVQQNYGHANEALAHPLGANFTELVSITDYRYKRFTAEWEFLYQVYGKDKDSTNWGQNIFLSYTNHPLEYGNKFWQGLKTQIVYTHFKLGYLIVPAEGIRAEAGLAVRKESNSVNTQSSTYFFIGIRTGLMNRYFDK